jgi:protoheme IX farnesyltransferase
MSTSALVTDVLHGGESIPSAASVRDYWTLLKPGVMALVVFTGAVGVFAAPVSVDVFTACVIILCIALGSGAGAALNMWYDADIDAIMTRTQKRPIPAGKIAASDVLAIGLMLAALSVALLGLATNWAAAGLLAFAIWFYACFYTMVLKRTTAQNIVIGGAAGAFPPVIGWLAVTPTLTWEPVLYFLIVFFWTPPHFWALALYRSGDYAQAHVPMLPVTAGIPTTLNHILAYSVILAATCALPYALGFSGHLYAVGAAALNGIFLHKAFGLWRSPSHTRAMRLFGYSIFYLFLLFSCILLDKLIPVFSMTNP